MMVGMTPEGTAVQGGWIHDRYRLERELGLGGSATVYLVYDRELNRQAALKLLMAHRDGDRLRLEARALAALDHPNVMKVYALGVHEGRDYLVMEFLERGSLADRLSREGPLEPAVAVQAMIEVLEGLGAAHAAGIVHRDVKPGNVLLRADGSCALCDFGIARTDGGADTKTGTALGSVPFMAPEQRIDPRQAGPQADLYAAACCLYNLLTGDTPIDLYLAADSSPRWQGVPAPLRAVLRQATRSEPSRRFHTAAEMADALRVVLPAVADLPAARGAGRPARGYAPTRGIDEPSEAAQYRERSIDVEAWRRTGTSAGRTALWVGISVIAVATVTFAWLGPLATLNPPANPLLPPVVAAAPEPSLAGTWMGTVGDHRGRMVLRGADALEGEVVVSLSAHELRTRVTGGMREGELVLVEALADPPQTFRARLHPSGLILEGDVERPGASPLPFALVRVE
jgi:Protein kinase domain